MLSTIMTVQDTTRDDKNAVISTITPFKKSFKSPGNALIFSAVLPGMGQFYMERWKRGLLFVALDGIAIGTWYHNNKLAEDKKREYTYYANQNWDLAHWIHDYYKWYEYKEGDDEWNSIREVFINSSDSLSGCAEDPTLGNCYVHIWDHSHGVEFTYEGKTIISSVDENDFKEAFEYLCDSPAYLSYCSKNLEDMDMTDKNGDTIVVVPSHHFYEGIGKYNMFFAGWDDNDSIYVVEKGNNDNNAMSNRKNIYRNLWNDYNYIKRLANAGGKFMFINRAVSMIDAIILAKKWNTKHDVKLSLNAYPDLRNKTGLGGVKLSINFK